MPYAWQLMSGPCIAGECPADIKGGHCRLAKNNPALADDCDRHTGEQTVDRHEELLALSHPPLVVCAPSPGPCSFVCIAVSTSYDHRAAESSQSRRVHACIPIPALASEDWRSRKRHLQSATLLFRHCIGKRTRTAGTLIERPLS